MFNLILFVIAALFFLAFCLIMLIGLIGKGMTRSEKIAAFSAGSIALLLFFAGLLVVTDE